MLRCVCSQDFTRKPPKLERFIRPTALRFKKANVTHRASRILWRPSPSSKLNVRFSRSRTQGDLPAPHYRRQEEPSVPYGELPRRSPPQVPANPLVQYTQLGVMTKGTIIEVNVRRQSDRAEPQDPALTPPFAGLRTRTRNHRRKGRLVSLSLLPPPPQTRADAL